MIFPQILSSWLDHLSSPDSLDENLFLHLGIFYIMDQDRYRDSRVTEILQISKIKISIIKCPLWIARSLLLVYACLEKWAWFSPSLLWVYVWQNLDKYRDSSCLGCYNQVNKFILFTINRNVINRSINSSYLRLTGML